MSILHREDGPEVTRGLVNQYLLVPRINGTRRLRTVSEAQAWSCSVGRTCAAEAEKDGASEMFHCVVRQHVTASSCTKSRAAHVHGEVSLKLQLRYLL
jgi:hypothetical protein